MPELEMTTQQNISHHKLIVVPYNANACKSNINKRHFDF